MKKILFPTDYSEVSNNAYLHALKLADVTGAALYTLHVSEMPIVNLNPLNMTMYNTYETLSTIERGNQEKHQEQIDYFNKQALFNNLGHIRMTHHYAQGYFLQKVEEFAEEYNINYIVMGTSGATGIKEFFFGSTTFKVMCNTKAILFGIPEDAPFIPIKRIAFAMQFSIEELDTLRRILKVTKKMKATIECIYVQTPNHFLQEGIIADWKAIFANDPVNFNILFSPDIERSIYQFIQDEKIELLAMLNHKRGFWDSFFHNSLSERLVHHVKIPVMALHE